MYLCLVHVLACEKEREGVHYRGTSCSYLCTGLFTTSEGGMDVLSYHYFVLNMCALDIPVLDVLCYHYFKHIFLCVLLATSPVLLFLPLNFI